MDEPQILARLTQIFEDVFDEESIKVTPELTAKDVDGWDSLLMNVRNRKGLAVR
jgi:acyl carrier protein